MWGELQGGHRKCQGPISLPRGPLLYLLLVVCMCFRLISNAFFHVIISICLSVALNNTSIGGWYK